MKTKTILAVLSLAVVAALALPAGTQEVLPRPEQSFGGKIGRTTKESVNDFPKAVEAPKGAPNVLLILGAEGMLLTHGVRFAGYRLYVLKGKPVFCYNLAGIARYYVTGKDKLKPRPHTILYDSQ